MIFKVGCRLNAMCLMLISILMQLFFSEIKHMHAYPIHVHLFKTA